MWDFMDSVCTGIVFSNYSVMGVLTSLLELLKSVDYELSMIQWCSFTFASSLLPTAYYVTLSKLDAVSLPLDP